MVGKWDRNTAWLLGNATLKPHRGPASISCRGVQCLWLPHQNHLSTRTSAHIKSAGWGGMGSTGLARILALRADLWQVSSLFCQPGPAALSRLLQAPTHTRAGVGQIPFPPLPLPFPSAEEDSILNAKGCSSGALLLPPPLTPLLSCLETDPGVRAATDGLFFNRLPLPPPSILRDGHGFSEIAIYLLIYKGRGKMIEGKINYYFSSLTK